MNAIIARKQFSAHPIYLSFSATFKIGYIEEFQPKYMYALFSLKNRKNRPALGIRPQYPMPPAAGDFTARPAHKLYFITIFWLRAYLAGVFT